MSYKTKLSLVRLLSVITLFGIIISTACGQSRSFSDITNIKQQHFGIIEAENTVKGYHFLYSAGKVRNGQRTYILRLMDENLQDINSTTFNDAKNTYALGSIFNGQSLCLKFKDDYLKTNTYRFFNKQGELYSTLKKEYYSETGDLYAIKNLGFVNYSSDYLGGTFKMEFMAEPDDIVRPWYYVEPKEKKSFKKGHFLAHSSETIFNLITDRPTRKSNRISFLLQGIDILTGTERFQIPIAAKYQTQPLKAYYNESDNSLYLIGLYYPQDAKITDDNGLGLFNFKIDNHGNVLEEKYLSWTYHFRDFIQVDNNGVVLTDNHKGFLYFHEVLKHADGSLIAIAEQYRKGVNGVAVAANVLAVALAASTGSYAGVGGMAKMVIGDMLIFRFSPEFDILDVKFLDKTKTNISLPSGYDFTNVHRMSNYIKNIGGFDYMYASQDNDKSLTAISYLDFEKNSGSPKEWVYNAATFYGDEFTTDSIPLGRPGELRSRRVLPAKTGYLLIVEYLKNENTVEAYLEKLDY